MLNHADRNGRLDLPGAGRDHAARHRKFNAQGCAQSPNLCPKPRHPNRWHQTPTTGRNRNHRDIARRVGGYHHTYFRVPVSIGQADFSGISDDMRIGHRNLAHRAPQVSRAKKAICRVGGMHGEECRQGRLQRRFIRLRRSDRQYGCDDHKRCGQFRDPASGLVRAGLCKTDNRHFQHLICSVEDRVAGAHRGYT